MERQDKLENIKEYLRVRKNVAVADKKYNATMEEYALGCKKAIDEIEAICDDFTRLERVVYETCATFNRNKITTYRCGYIHIYDKVKRELERKY
jgi:endonuclease IV